MLTEEMLEKIASGEVSSRRQVYSVVGRSKRLRQWMDENKVLMPKRYNKQTLITRLRDFYEREGRMPVAMDDWTLAKRCQEHFGSWNEAIFQAFGTYNQKRYDHFSDEEMLGFVTDYIKTNQRLPLREEFDGGRLPYFEAITSRFGLSKWSEVLVLAGAENMSHYPGKRGWGKVHAENGRIYLSRQEMLIGRYLDSKGLEFEQEVPYGSGNYRFDFFVPHYDVYIEYYGIATGEYLERVERKRDLYAGRYVIEIFKHENTVGKLDSEVQRL